MNSFQKWIKKNGFVFSILFLGGLGLLFIFGHIIWVICKGENVFEELGQKDKPLYLLNIIFAIAAIATAIFTWWKNVINNKQAEASLRQADLQQRQYDAQQEQINIQKEQSEKQLEIQNDVRLDSLFAKAVEFLNDGNDLLTRKGGVHILKDLAINSSKHAQQCIDMLCSINEVWMPFVLNQCSDFFMDKKFDWVNKKISNEDLAEKFKIKGIKEKYSKVDDLVEEISVSQTAIKHIQSIIEYYNNVDYVLELNFSYKYLCGLRFTGNTKLNNCVFENCILVGSHLKNYNNCEVEFIDCDLRGAKFSFCNFTSSNFKGSDFKFSSLKDSKFKNCNFHSSSLKFSEIFRSLFSEATFNEADFFYSDISECYFDGASLIQSNLSFCNIHYSNFRGVFSPNVNLSYTNFLNCDFRGSNLYNSNFVGSELKKVDFSCCIWMDTCFFGASIEEVIFRGGIFFDVNFKGAFMNITPQLILGDFLFIEDDVIPEFFESDDAEFYTYLKEYYSHEFKDAKISFETELNRKISSARKIYQKYKLDNRSLLFDVLKDPNDYFMNIWYGNSLCSKLATERMLKIRIVNVHSLYTKIMDTISFRLGEYIRMQKPDWYEEFKAEGIIKE